MIQKVTVIAVAALLTWAQPASACAPTDWQCQAVWTCVSQPWFGWQAVNHCAYAGPVCTAFNEARQISYHLNCTSMSQRGGDDNVLADVFKAGRSITDSAGKLIEIDKSSGEMLQVATSISALQRRGANIGSDVNAAFAEAGIPIVDSVTVEVAEDTETGEQTFTLRGESSADVVMRFDADGKPVQEIPSPEAGKDESSR
jgi:hypothetical protein